MRINQYKKQIIVLLPIISLGANFSMTNIVSLACTFILFSISASAIYIYNDICDFDEDKKDIYRSSRAIASEKISIRSAYLLIFFFTLIFVVFFIYASIVNKYEILSMITLYLLLNIFYSKLNLKKYSILGITIIALGFSLRFACGTFSLGLDFSFWAFTLIFILSIFILSGKRYQLAERKNQTSSNEVMNFWIASMLISGLSFISIYSAFISDYDNQNRWGDINLLLSNIPLVLAIIRYSEIVIRESSYKNRDVSDFFISDPILIFLVFIFFIILWVGRVGIN